MIRPLTLLLALLAATPLCAEPEALADYGSGPVQLLVQGAADITSFGPVMQAFT